MSPAPRLRRGVSPILCASLYAIGFTQGEQTAISLMSGHWYLDWTKSMFSNFTTKALSEPLVRAHQGKERPGTHFPLFFPCVPLWLLFFLLLSDDLV
jgi:hypothetical protein